MLEPTAHSTDTNLRATLAWGVALNYGDESNGLPKVCLWFFAASHTSLSIALRPVLTNDACAKLIISFLLIESREGHVLDDLQEQN